MEIRCLLKRHCSDGVGIKGLEIGPLKSSLNRMLLPMESEIAVFLASYHTAFPHKPNPWSFDMRTEGHTFSRNERDFHG